MNHSLKVFDYSFRPMNYSTMDFENPLNVRDLFGKEIAGPLSPLDLSVKITDCLIKL